MVPMDTEFIKPNDVRWRTVLKNTPHDIYHLPEYLEFASRFEGGLPTAFYAQTNGTTLLIPLLLRELPASLSTSASLRDATTPYGYPAPLVYPSSDSETIRQLFKAFQYTAKNQGIISAFLRLHPLIPFPLDMLASYGKVIHHGQTVWVDLSIKTEDAWAQIRHGHQDNVRQLIENGFQTVLDDWSFYGEFINLYRETMKRLSASEFYIFSNNYFEELRQELEEHVHLCAVVAPSGEIACAGLFFTVCNIVQYHLSGSAASYSKYAPTKLMLDFMRRWSKEQGYRYYHLGGGVGGEQDSLFNFKAGFSKLRGEFHTCRMVLDQNQYDQVVDLWKSVCKDLKPSSDYFPLYRSEC